MTKVKFRVFNKKTKELLNVDTLYIDEKMLRPEGGDEYSVYNYNNEYYSDLMQYTGLQDENGISIYEGDIVYLAGKGNTLIEFPFIDLYESCFENDIGSIIGNIYQNPKLLEGA